MHGTTAPPPGRTPTEPREGRPLARAFGVTAALSLAASLLGLVRDLLLARYFGAGRGTDAFLVAWSVPETAAPLLIDSAMPLLMMPAFSAALAARRTSAAADAAVETSDPVRTLVAATLPRLCLVLAAVSAATAWGAPHLVALLAPGLPDPALAVTCTRLTSLTVVTFGISGYLASGLRAHQHFTIPATVYIAYNLGIVGVTALGHNSLGVRATALGVAVGGVLMVAAVLPAFSRHCCRLKSGLGLPRPGGTPAPVTILGLHVLLPVVVFALTRQCQVYIERALASSLAPGTISHLNYAEKVAQMPMALAVMISTVSLPVVALAMAKGDTEHARERTEKDLKMVAAIALAATAFLVACAPQVVTLLFQRGAFTAADTAVCATVMRVYCLGLLGQALVGAVARPFFSVRPVVRVLDDAGGAEAANADRGGWFPTAAMAAGLAATVAVSVLAVPAFGASGLAAGNAAGITLTAGLLLSRLRNRGIPVRMPRILSALGRLTAAAACAAGASACAVAAVGPDPLAAVLIGAVVTPLVFGGSAWLLGVRVAAGSA
ncbi:murein biosynthesis integral membrane protein MurJ [Kitasatospora cinereorecta]|uniref:Murein biosynthesis integral membrane protein MurJ n=1 Tax=Kitasatospora cinereorecta TaxID=285560 RepID=A0ABW0V361_9ACTN